MEVFEFFINFITIFAILMLCGSIYLATLTLYAFYRILSLEEIKKLNKLEFAIVVLLLFVGAVILFKTLVKYIILGG